MFCFALAGANQRLKKMMGDAEWHHALRWFAIAMLVGAVAGIGAVTFQYCSQWLFEYVLGDIVGYHPRLPGGETLDTQVLDHGTSIHIWLLLLIPTLGGLLSGLLVFRFAPEAEGHGTDAALDVYHHQSGIMAWRVPVVKTIASILTLGTGGSGGREGPIAQIGGGFGSIIASKLGLNARQRRILLTAGLGAGVGAVFRAPLAGALFAAEIHYRDTEFESEAIVPAAIASITSYCIFGMVFGWGALFTSPEFNFANPLELVPYTVLALAVSLGAWLFVRIFYRVRDIFAALNMPAQFKPAIGAGLTGLCGVVLYFVFDTPEVLSVMAFGYGTLQGALDGHVGLTLLLVVAICKMFTTGLTIGSGGSGGVFGPSMVIGGCIGGAVGLALNQWFPGLVPQPGAYVLVGMAGFFSGAANTPISTIIMVSEMTNHYELLLPSLWVCIIAYLLLGKTSLYEKQLRTKSESPAHRGDFHIDVLENLTVADAVEDLPHRDIITFFEGDSMGDILHRAGHTTQMYFPVLNVEGQMTGIISLNDIREFMYEESMWSITIALDIATTNVTWTTLGDNLSTVMQQLTRLGVDELPIMAKDKPGILRGFIRRREVLDLYNRRVWKLQSDAS